MDLTKHLANLYLLVRIIDAGGFSAAARELGTTRSLLSRRIIALERALDTRLLHRDARHLSVTAVGTEVYQQAIAMCDAANAAVEAAHTAQGNGHTLLRTSMTDVVAPLMSSMLTGYAEQDPAIQLQTSTQYELDALYHQKSDLVVHHGHERPKNGDIAVHPLGNARIAIVGTPSLLQQLGHPQQPDDVESQYRIVYSQGWTPEWSRHARLVSDHIDAMVESARAGIGLAEVPIYACYKDLASGRLQQAFETYTTEPLRLHALTLSRRAASQVPLDFIHFVKNQLANTPELCVRPL